jgi:hypothetical protein
MLDRILTHADAHPCRALLVIVALLLLFWALVFRCAFAWPAPFSYVTEYGAFTVQDTLHVVAFWSDRCVTDTRYSTNGCLQYRSQTVIDSAHGGNRELYLQWCDSLSRRGK